MNQTEKEIENHFKKFGRKLGWEYKKQQGMGNRGKTDSYFRKAVRQIIFVEFKRPGKKLTTLQEKEVLKLRAMGFFAIGIDSIKSGQLFFQYVEDKLLVPDDPDYPLLSSDLEDYYE